MSNTPQIQTLDTGDLLARLARAMEGLLDVSQAYEDDELDRALYDPFYEIVEAYSAIENAVMPTPESINEGILATMVDIDDLLANIVIDQEIDMQALLNSVVDIDDLLASIEIDQDTDNC